MKSISILSKKINKLLEKRQEDDFVPNEEPPPAVLFSSFIPDNAVPRATCRFKDLIYIDNRDLIEPNSNLYFYNSALCVNPVVEDTYRLFYRVGKEPKGYRDRIATCLLDSEFKVIPNTNKYLSLYSNWDESVTTLALKRMMPTKFKIGEHVEDPRAVIFNNSWFVFYTDGAKVGVAKLNLRTCETIYSHYLFPPQNVVHKESDGREKNWIPFVSENMFYIMYSEMPRTILTCNDTGTSLNIVNYKKTSAITGEYWYYGNVRGGTPPVRYDNDHLIWFFHSQVEFESHIGKKRTYMIGAYVSKATFPFEVVKVSLSPLLIGIASHCSADRSLQDYVVFPCGAINTHGGWKLSMGVNDYETAFLDVCENNFIWKKIVKPYSVLNLSSVLNNE